MDGKISLAAAVIVAIIIIVYITKKLIFLLFIVAVVAVYIVLAKKNGRFPYKKKEANKNASRGTRRGVDIQRPMDFISMQYNIFGRPYAVSHDGQKERIQQIPDAIDAMITKRVGAPDIISFCELDNEDDRKNMLSKFKTYGYPHATAILKGSMLKGSLINGGVVIFSRWPIVKEDQLIYHNACTFADCLAAKGVVYVRIIKEIGGAKKAFNIFATHMQAWPQDKSRGSHEVCNEINPCDPALVRQKQAKMMTDFIKAQKIPSNEPVILQGDFNTDMVLFPQEVMDLMNALNSQRPNLTTRTWGQRFSSDPTSNILVGRDGGSGSPQPSFPGGCSAEYEKGWGPKRGKIYTQNPANRLPYKNTPVTTLNPPGKPLLNFFTGDGKDPLNTSAPGTKLYLSSQASGDINSDPVAYCPCCPTEFYDLILAVKNHQLPTKSSLEICPLKSSKRLRVPWEGKMQPVADPKIVGSYMELYDLSDHYPVVAHFQFEVLPGPVYIPDGCKRDGDCHYDVFNFDCKCTGPGCTYNSKSMKAKTGWFSNRPQDKRDHPLNRNCKFAGGASDTCVCRASAVY